MSRVSEFLAEHRPDLLLLQETKCSPDQFPADELAECGYSAVAHSTGRWCGVAVLAPASAELSDPALGLPDEPNPEEGRWVEASAGDIRVVSVYVPNGREVGSEHYEAKIEFLDCAARRVAELAGAGPLIVGGDMNVAPEDIDVWDMGHFADSTHVTEPEREALSGLIESGGLADAHTTLHPGEQQFTWWDYRGGSFHRGLGMRIDHLLLSAGLVESLRSCTIARDYRKGPKPSDHVPLMIELDR